MGEVHYQGGELPSPILSEDRQRRRKSFVGRLSLLYLWRYSEVRDTKVDNHSTTIWRSSLRRKLPIAF